MLLESKENYRIFKLEGRSINTKDGIKVTNPIVKTRLLSISELTKVQMMVDANESEDSIFEEIFGCCYLGLLGISDESIIDINSLPLIVNTLAALVLTESREICQNIDTYFTNIITTSLYPTEVWAGYIANILNIEYYTVLNKPVDELVRLYTIAYIVSGKTIPPIERTN